MAFIGYIIARLLVLHQTEPDAFYVTFLPSPFHFADMDSFNRKPQNKSKKKTAILSVLHITEAISLNVNPERRAALIGHFMTISKCGCNF